MSRGFPDQISGALDSYGTPPLPAGFTDRLVEKALAQSQIGSSATGTQPDVRRTRRWSNPWRRGGYIASSLAGLGLVSAAAAAALSLAEIPVRIPIVSDLVEQVLPARSKPVQTAKAEPVEKVGAAAPIGAEVSEQEIVTVQKPWREMTRLEKREVIKERVAANEAKLQQRRADRGLSPLTETQLRRRRAAIRRGIANGSIPRATVRRTVRRVAMEKRLESRRKRLDHSQETRPEPKAVKTVVESSETGLPVVTPASNISEKPEDDNTVTDQLVSAETTEPQTAADGKAQLNNTVPKAQTIPPAKVELLKKLPANVRKKLQQASPAERRQMLRELRNRRENTRKLRSARQKLRAIRKNRK